MLQVVTDLDWRIYRRRTCRVREKVGFEKELPFSPSYCFVSNEKKLVSLFAKFDVPRLDGRFRDIFSYLLVWVKYFAKEKVLKVCLILVRGPGILLLPLSSALRREAASTYYFVPSVNVSLAEQRPAHIGALALNHFGKQHGAKRRDLNATGFSVYGYFPITQGVNAKQMEITY